MKLPSSLAPWASYLNIFPDEIGLTLGDLVRPISSVVNMMKPVASQDDGEPNGYDGVARRGIYERLLLSELALADEFGDEFIRRAVMGEHLFLNLAKVSEGEKRISVALFDTGALQLGTPRLAHLAAFIVLARRAEAANATFYWGVLQDSKQPVLSDDTESSIKILLESRVAQTVSEDDLVEWSEKLAEVSDRSDVWLIGSERLEDFPGVKNFSRLYIDETLEIGNQGLRLVLKSASGVEKEIFLDLPPANLCTQILRNPFMTKDLGDATNVEIDQRVTSFSYDGSGAKLLLRLSRSTIDCIDIQNSAKITNPKTTRLKDSVPIVAVGRVRKSLVFATAVDDFAINLNVLKSRAFPSGEYRATNVPIVFPAENDGIMRLFDVRAAHFHGRELALLDAAGNLFLAQPVGDSETPAEGGAGVLGRIATNVLDAVSDSQGMLFVGCRDGRSAHFLISSGRKVEQFKLTGGLLSQAIFGYADKGRRVVAVETFDGEWSIFDAHGNRRQMPRPEGEVFGVMKDSRLAPFAGLFSVSKDRRGIVFTWGFLREIKFTNLIQESTEIIRAKVNPSGATLCYQTANNEFVIYSLTRHRVLYRFSK